MLTHPWLIKTNLSCIDKKFLTIICSIEEVKNIAYLYLPDGCWRDMHVATELMLLCFSSLRYMFLIAFYFFC